MPGRESNRYPEQRGERLAYYLQYMKCGIGFVYKNQYNVELCQDCFNANPEVYGFRLKLSHAIYRPNETCLTCAACRRRPRTERPVGECVRCTDKLLEVLEVLEEHGESIEDGPHCYYEFNVSEESNFDSSEESDAGTEPEDGDTTSDSPEVSWIRRLFDLSGEE